MENNKKGLKKLSLQKEEIVNLNDHEMGALIGGTSGLCLSRVIINLTNIISITVGDTSAVPDAPVSEGVTNCILYGGCYISEIEVLGLNTGNPD